MFFTRLTDENDSSGSTNCTINCTTEHCGGIFFGGVLILAGVAFILAHLGRLPAGFTSAWQLWPALLVWGGICNLATIRHGGSLAWGLGLVGAGGALLASKAGIIALSWSLIWPALLIFAGIMVVWGTFFHKSKKWHTFSKDIHTGRFETSIVMGAREDSVTSREFEGGYIHCVMGGIELDMREAEILGNEAVLDVKVVMGGIELFVPPHWEVVSRCTPMLGGVENKTRSTAGSETPTKRLIINGAVIMGGIEIRL